MSTENPNTLFRIFPASYDGPIELEGTDFNNLDDQRQASHDSGEGELIIARHQLEDGQRLLEGEFPEDTVFGIDVDSGTVLVNLGQFPDQPADELWKNSEHQVQYSFGLEEARQVYGA